MPELLPISAIVPTRHRSQPLARMLASLAEQSTQPLEAIVVDGSDDGATETVCRQAIQGLQTKIRYYRAERLGAAIQRNQAATYVTQNTIWLADDDILLEPECVARLWAALQSDPRLGGVNATIANQGYQPPGRLTGALLRFLNDGSAPTYAGRCLGPAFNLLPEDLPELPVVVPTEWLNSTCTLYRREALPEPLFPPVFTGYSLFEDVTLSLRVSQRGWKLANARTARIYHDSQPGDHKNNPVVLARMAMVNRYYVMTRVLGRTQPRDRLKFAVLQLFETAAAINTDRGWQSVPAVAWGKLSGLGELWRLPRAHLPETTSASAIARLCQGLATCHRLAGGLQSRWRNAYYRALGVRLKGYIWMRDIEIPRNFSDIEIASPCALDRGVTLLCVGHSLHSPKIRIGPNCYFNRGTFLDAAERIEIGSDCAFGPNCYITDHDHGLDPEKTPLEQPLLVRPTKIGDRVWLGAGAIVLKGVTIGSGTIVGAGSVVTRDLPPNAVAVGAPARVLRFRDAQQQS